MRKVLLLCLTLPLSVTACTDEAKAPVSISFFGTSPASIEPGESASLVFITAHATSCEVDNNVGELEIGIGSIVVAPTTAATYQLTCYGHQGPVVATAELYVAPPVAINSLSVSPTQIDIGESATLDWDASEATRCEVDNGVGIVEVGVNSVDVSPVVPTDYTLTCEGTLGPVSETVSLGVRPQVEVTSFAPTDGAIALGVQTDLNWTTLNADSCSIDQGIGNVNVPDDSVTIGPLTEATTYTVTCDGSGGPVSLQTTVDVLLPAQILFFGASPTFVDFGATATLTWVTQDTVTCSIDNGVGAVGVPDGFVNVMPAATTPYTLSCTGTGGNDVAAATVTVGPPEDPDAIHVDATTGVDDATCATRAAPCLTIQHGITRSAIENKLRVLVASGLYNENVFVRDGVDLLGGYNPSSWVRDPDLNVSLIAGANFGATDRVAVRANNISLPTEISGFTIVAANAGPPAGNSIGFYALNPSGGLTITNNVIYAGSGADGRDGTKGSGFGFLGGSGGQGNNSGNDITCGLGLPPGPTGAAGFCGMAMEDVSGGNGSPGAEPFYDVQNLPAQNGSASGEFGAGAAGAAGISGYHMEGQVIMGTPTCILPTNGPVEGADGQDGTDGIDGTGGSGVSDGAGLFNGTQWRGFNGGDGTVGTPGGGGGGGGSPGGLRTAGGGACYRAPTGGGGGSGGCAAPAGSGGDAGGASFAIFIAINGPGPGDVSDLPTITNNRLARGAGGSGGDGGLGGLGPLGGVGGAGGLALSSGTFGFCLVHAGNGGSGGRGGHGGGGGGAGGGVSFDIWVNNTNGFDPGYSTSNTFLISGATHGVGGESGSAPTGLTTGGAGVDGISGDVNLVP